MESQVRVFHRLFSILPRGEDRVRALLLTLLAAFAFAATPAHAERIKDLGNFQGVRPNQLTGYGIVVGLAGTGDDSIEYATQGMKGVVSRFGLTLPQGVNPALKNAAAVLVTADLPAFSKPGQRLDVTVSALGKAKSLRGGTLIMTPLRGADNEIYAMAQGNLAVGGLGVSGADGSQVSVNIPSAGRIPSGATVERAVATGFDTAPTLTFNLAEADLTTALRVADGINRTFGDNRASAVDAVSVTIAAGRGAAHHDDGHDREYRDRTRRRAGQGDRQRPHRHRRHQRRGQDSSRRRGARKTDRQRQ